MALIISTLLLLTLSWLAYGQLTLENVIQPSNFTPFNVVTYTFAIPYQNTSLYYLAGPLQLTPMPDDPSIGGYSAQVVEYVPTYTYPQSIALIPCDAPNSVDLFKGATDVPLDAIVLYSILSKSCTYVSAGTESSAIFSTASQDTAASLYHLVVTEKIRFNGTLMQTSPSTNTDTNTGYNPFDSGSGGGSSTTSSDSTNFPNHGANVAMILLYAVTGVVSLLFLAVLAMGAMRARQNPERYGIRNAQGQRVIRPRGIARAVLDTFPIVRTRASPDSDAEKGENDFTEMQERRGTNKEQQQAVSSNQNASQAGQEGDRGTCPICMDDYEPNTEVRMLPCSHQFHPACVDPWLLNIASFCPLCRRDVSARENDSENQDVEGRTPPDAPLPPSRGEGVEEHRTRVDRYLILMRRRDSNRDSINEDALEEIRGNRGRPISQSFRRLSAFTMRWHPSSSHDQSNGREH